MRRVAAIVNRNAGGVTAAVIEAARRTLGAEHVFVTASADDARAAMATIVTAGYAVVCSGGGDGTFVQAVADLAAMASPPILFGLRLGSGNAIADVCGAGPATRAGLVADLARAASDEAPGVLRLLEVRGRLSHSVGLGLDADFNLDLDRIAKAGRRRAWLRPLLQGSAGLIATASLRTLPRLVRGQAPRIRIVAIGSAARIDSRGRVIGQLADGAVLHDGAITIAAASTVTTYGRGVEFFPSTEREPDRFQLRVAHVGAVDAVRDLVQILRGAHDRLIGVDDFLVGAVAITAIDRCAAHSGGEVWWPEPGTPTRVALAPRRIPVLRARR